MNVTAHVGRLTADPESNSVTTQNGAKTVAKGTIAVNENKDTTYFFNFEVWGQPADFLVKFAKKGSLVSLQGSLKQDKWKDKDSGQNREKVYISATRVNLLGPKSDNEEAASDSPATVAGGGEVDLFGID